MKKLVGLLIILSLTASVHAGLDVSFSSENSGNWSYSRETSTFSFTVAGIDNTSDDILVQYSDSVIIPDIEVSGLEQIISVLGIETGVYIGDVALAIQTTEIEVKNGKGGGNNDPVLTGNLSTGIIVVTGTTASLYPILGEDISTNWRDRTGPELMDFSLTLQGGIDIADMILLSNENTPSIAGGSFSGSMTQVPEPATLFVLAMGSVLLLKKE